MQETKSYILNQLQACLGYYGIKFMLRDDRAKGGPYISIGDNRFKRSRAQFWVEENTHEIKVWIGINMDRMYTNALHSKYKKEWDTERNNEVYLCFPDLFLAIDYIRRCAHHEEKASA